MSSRIGKPLAAVASIAVVLAAAVLAAAPDGEPPPPRSGSGGTTAALPAPDAPLRRDPRALAAALASTSTALETAIDRWRRNGDPSRPGVPRDVALLAFHEQRIYRVLGTGRRLARATVARLPTALRRSARDNVLARRELSRITSVRRGPPPTVQVGPAEPADVLRRLYRAAQRRFHVSPAVLAAVNFVESAFGRLRNRSVSGAKGPMQFMPATWRAYGHGDVNDPHDAILGAADYLHANGAPRSERRALFHYNPSRDYVDAVSRYARRIRADWRAFYGYYAWQVYVGNRRLTDPRG
jgi:membrane-bound lytic murein transglycosylase B